MTEDEKTEIVERVVQHLDEREAKQAKEMAERLWNPSDEDMEAEDQRVERVVQAINQEREERTASDLCRVFKWTSGILAVLVVLLLFGTADGREFLAEFIKFAIGK